MKFRNSIFKYTVLSKNVRDYKLTDDRKPEE